MSELPTNSRFDFWHLHFIVFVLAFTGIIGKIITIPAMELVIIRMFFASIGVWLLSQIFRVKGNFQKINKRAFLNIVITGILVALHWYTFYHSIKISNVSIALACFSAGTLFTSLLEPLFFKRKISMLQVVVGIIVILGLGIIFQFELRYVSGIIVGLISAFLAALFSVCNAALARKNYNYNTLSTIELFTGFVFLSLVFYITEGKYLDFSAPTKMDWFWLFVLGFIMTTYGFTIVIELMRRMSAYEVNLAFSLEPVYAIVLAFLIFGDSEKMSLGFYVGAAIVLLAVVFYPFFERRKVE